MGEPREAKHRTPRGVLVMGTKMDDSPFPALADWNKVVGGGDGPGYRRATITPHREDAARSEDGTNRLLSATGFVLIKEESIRLRDIQPPGASAYFFPSSFSFSLMPLPPGKT